MLLEIASVTPPYRVEQSVAAEELKKRMGNRPAVSRMIDAAAVHSGIESRFIVMPDADPLLIRSLIQVPKHYLTIYSHFKIIIRLKAILQIISKKFNNFLVSITFEIIEYSELSFQY